MYGKQLNIKVEANKTNNTSDINFKICKLYSNILQYQN